MSPFVQSLVMGLFCSAIGVGMGFKVWSDAIGKGYEDMPLLAGTSSLLVGTFLWWFLVVRKSKYTIKRGLATGLLIAPLSHYLVWYLSFLTGNFSYWILGQKVGSLDEPPIDPLNGIWAAIPLALWSLLFYGWMTLPAGGLIGAFYGWFLRRKRP